jgi:DDB1- and CUL4-associated factor 6
MSGDTNTNKAEDFLTNEDNDDVEDSDDESWKDLPELESEDSDSDYGFYGQSISKLSAGKHIRCTNHVRDYRGHCNVDTTKDVNFYGLQDEYIVSGSDCGSLFIWEKKTGRLVNILEGDQEVVNVIQRKFCKITPLYSCCESTNSCSTPIRTNVSSFWY